MKFRIPTLDSFVWGAVIGATLLGILLVFWFFHGPSITITNNQPGKSSPVSTLTGLPCQDPGRRPVAVMVASDPEARPLSGLTAADMVFEMPVTPNGITRMMAVYQCGPDPKEIGSIRSARQDFIPLAQGLKAVFAHWGGEAGALEELNNHILDNINGLLYDGTVFLRKKNIPAPHNGFSTLALISGQAAKLSYSTSANFTGYLHESGVPALNLGALVDHVIVSWPQHMDVDYRYDASTNTYARWRGGTPEMDATTGKQVYAGVVVVMNTDSTFLHDQYISVRTLGKGTATVYQDGRSISANWQKPAAQDMLTFTDANNKPIPLAPGKIWIEINPPLPAVH